jgi:hypothetical protein
MSATSWSSANGSFLLLAVAWLRARLAGERELTPPEWDGPADTAPALTNLVANFELTPFERDLLLWCFSNELDGAHPAGAPTFGHAIASLPNPDVRALSPLGPLRRFRLIEIAPGEPLLPARLRLAERVTRYLLGDASPDVALTDRLLPHERLPILDPENIELSARAEALAELANPADLAVTVACVRGLATSVRRAVAVAAAESLGCLPCVLAPQEGDLEAFVPAWERERRLLDVVLVLELDEDTAPLGRRLLERIGGPVFVSSARPLDLGDRSTPAVDLGEPRFDVRAARWARVLGPSSGDHTRLAAAFRLDESEIEAIGAELVAAGADGSSAWEAARRRVRHDPAPLAELIVSEARWDDLVLPPPQLALLRELVAQHRHQATVQHSWGMGGRGGGLIALFGGPSGVGKTLSAEVIANDLGLDLWRLDLSSVVSKYIGETEKNLARVFDAAERASCVLLFDEADALFGKRTEVRDSHDRHANVEVSYLLQRLERYAGVAILTTNLRANVDTAFLRRFRFIVDFTTPGPAERRVLWSRVFGARVPTGALDFVRLAQLNATGATIRNIALRSAHLAAAERTSVEMRHLLIATRSDYDQRAQRVTRAELDGWEDSVG